MDNFNLAIEIIKMKQKIPVLALVGPAGSGKDYLINILQDNFNYHKKYVKNLINKLESHLFERRAP